jgi:hypothetical protein
MSDDVRDLAVTEPGQTVKPPAIVGPQAPGPTRTEMSLADLHRNGILWWINKALLHDVGLAIAVEADQLRPGEGENSRRYVRLFVEDFTPPTRIIDPADHESWESWQRWLQTRTGRILP